MKIDWTKAEIKFVLSQYKKGYSRHSIAKLFKQNFSLDRSANSIKHCIETYGTEIEKDLPKVLLLDVETKPKKAWVWGSYDQNVGTDMLIEDGAILSWSAKWLGDPENKVIYKDQRGNEKNLLNDKKIMQPLRDLLDDADIVIWQNGDSFDYGEINNRLIEHEIEPPSPYKTIDTVKMARKHFRFFTNKLAHMTAKFCKKYKKQDHKMFPGFSMWDECMKGNIKAWNCMKEYNKFDVLSLEELFLVLAKYAKGDAKIAAAMRTYNASKK
jgi:hypothetical protein